MTILIRMTIFKKFYFVQLAVQARELTTLQSILADQIESHGKFVFREGSQVIPGQASFQIIFFPTTCVNICW